MNEHETASRFTKLFWAIVAYLQALIGFAVWLWRKMRFQMNLHVEVTLTICAIAIGCSLVCIVMRHADKGRVVSSQIQLEYQRTAVRVALNKLIIQKQELGPDEARIILRGSWRNAILPELKSLFPKLRDSDYALRCKFADCLMLKTPNVLDLRPKVGKLKPDFLREDLAKDILRYAQEPTQWKNASWYHTNLLIMFVVTRDSFEGDPTPTLHALFHPTAIWVEGPKPS